MKRKLWQNIAWSLMILLTLVMLGFVDHQQDDRVCKDIDIKIDRSNGNFFINEADINAMVYHEMDTVVGRPIDRIDAARLEHKLNNHPTISNAEVYKTLEGELVIDVMQRTPIVRVFSLDGDSYYIDSTGSIMPPSASYTSRVFVANGHIYDNFLEINQMNAAHPSDSLKANSYIDDIYEFAQFIRKEPFWRRQIEQLYVNKELEIELIPRVGNHRIVFGDASDLEGKFKKLKIFYKEGLAKTGWNEYSVINLKYADQVVCTKR